MAQWASKEGRALCGAVASRGGHDVTGIRACSYVCALRHLITLLYITHHFSGINEEGCAFRRRRHYRGDEERKEKRKNQLVFSYFLSLYPWFSLLRNALKHTLLNSLLNGQVVVTGRCVRDCLRGVATQGNRGKPAPSTVMRTGTMAIIHSFYNSPSPRTNLYVRLGRLSLSLLERELS